LTSLYRPIIESPNPEEGSLMSLGVSLHRNQDSADMQCPDCGIKYMRRLFRRGFVQTKVLAFFGFYPWECPVCRKPHYYKERRQEKQTNATD
jgi:rubredoxin